MIALNETNEYAAEVAFTLPLDSDPLTGLTGYTFTVGEVQIKLPGGVWISPSVSQLGEKGYGRFCVRLTAAQTVNAGDVFIRAEVAGTQYYFGSDVIGQLGGDIAVDSTTGSVSFFLPLETDPINGAPLTGHTFVSGEVRVCTPDSAYTDATPSQVDEIGFGGFRLRLTAGQTAKAGKVFVYANVSGYQRWEGYCTILNAQTADDVTPDPEPEPTPVPVPIVYGDPEYVNQYALALNRLPQQFRSGTLDYTITSLDSILDSYVPTAATETVDLGDSEFGAVFDFTFGSPYEVAASVPHIASALNRLPQQFRSGELVYTVPEDVTAEEVVGVYVAPVVEYDIEVPAVEDPGTAAHLASALGRLPQQFRSGTLIY
jgi:hypothetical protein